MFALKESNSWNTRFTVAIHHSVVIVGLTRAVLIDLGKSVTNAELFFLRIATRERRALRLAGYTDGVATMRRKAIGR